MPFYLWLIVAIIFIIIEIFTAGFFYACFGAGALAAMITAYFTESIIWQIGVFCVVSVVLIPATRSFARKISDDSVPQAGADALIGMTGVVTETIRVTEGTGMVRVDGQRWRANAANEIAEGENIKVTDVRGAKLIVEEVVKQGGSDD
jgi:membrane protein implicated in regulation of membrane protease activity